MGDKCKTPSCDNTAWHPSSDSQRRLIEHEPGHCLECGIFKAAAYKMAIKLSREWSLPNFVIDVMYEMISPLDLEKQDE